jgi:hypothetical protein
MGHPAQKWATRERHSDPCLAVTLAVPVPVSPPALADALT